MQLPKLMGGTAGTGELPELVRHLVRVQVHPLSLGLGGGGAGDPAGSQAAETQIPPWPSW